MAKITLKNVQKIYPNGAKAVDDFNLEIKDKEFLVLVGPSGCGKSTTLRMIAGLEEITAGEVHIGEKKVNGVLAKDRNVAMVFQNYAIYPHMNVFTNISYGLKIRKYKKDKINELVFGASDILGIRELLGRKPSALSGGQRQRVALGRAIVRQPDVFLFDEPLSNLDAKLRNKMRTELNRLHTRLDTTMIYVTHDQIEAMTMGDRIVVMKDGIIQQVDKPMRLYNFPENKYVAGFIGMPQINFLKGKIINEENSLCFYDEASLKIPLTGQNKILKKYIEKEVFMGIRSEDLGSLSAIHAKNKISIKGKIEVIEPLGSETYVYLKNDEHEFTARVEPNNNYKVGDEVELPLNLGKIHLFDAETEFRIKFNEERV